MPRGEGHWATTDRTGRADVHRSRIWLAEFERLSLIAKVDGLNHLLGNPHLGPGNNSIELRVRCNQPCPKAGSIAAIRIEVHERGFLIGDHCVP